MRNIRLISIMLFAGFMLGFGSSVNATGNSGWVITWDSDKLTNITNISLCPDDSFVVLGSAYGQTDIDPGPGTVTYESPEGTFMSILCKYGTDGSYMWSFPFDLNGKIRAIHMDTDSAGNVYVTGSYEGMVDLDPGPGEGIYVSDQDGYFTSKFDTSGNLVWTNGQTGSSSITVDGAGNVYLGGTRTSGGAGWAYYAELNPEGDTISGGRSRYNAHEGGDSGYLYGINPVYTNDPYYAMDHIVIERISGTERVEITSFDHWIRDIADDSDGNIIIGGTFEDPIDLDPGDEVMEVSPVGRNDVYLCKLDPSGNLMWAKTWGSSESWASNSFYHLGVDPRGNIVVTGTYETPMDFDPGPGEYILDAYGFPLEYVSKFDPAGNLLWVFTYGSVTSYGHAVSDLMIDEYGYIYIVGDFEGTVDFCPGDGVDERVGASQGSGYILKLTPDGTW